MITKDSPLEPGTLVKNYKIVEQVGKGGMGAVYRAIAPDGETVALKILAAHLTDNDVQRKRFYQEAEVAMRLDHPNIVRAIEVGESEGQHFFAMEFVEGENLGKRIKEFGRLPEEESIRIICEVAEALEKAHSENLVHRDVKPDNVMITPDGAVKLADMGLMKQLENDLNLTKTGKGLGTPHFMAPEQFRDAKNADARCDVYSLGATLYMMVTGELPFRSSSPLDSFIKKSKNEYKPPRELNPELSQRVATIIQMTMEADRDNRPQSARSFADLLQGKQPLPTTNAKASKAAKPSTPAPQVASADPPADIWYVIFKGPNGAEQKVKGSTSAIEKQIARGRIGLDATVCKNKAGKFESIRNVAEFNRALERQAAGASDDFEDLEAITARRSSDLPRSPISQQGKANASWRSKLGRREWAIVAGVSLAFLLAIMTWFLLR